MSALSSNWAVGGSDGVVEAQGRAREAGVGLVEFIAQRGEGAASVRGTQGGEGDTQFLVRDQQVCGAREG